MPRGRQIRNGQAPAICAPACARRVPATHPRASGVPDDTGELPPSKQSVEFKMREGLLLRIVLDAQKCRPAVADDHRLTMPIEIACGSRSVPGGIARATRKTVYIDDAAFTNEKAGVLALKRHFRHVRGSVLLRLEGKSSGQPYFKFANILFRW